MKLYRAKTPVLHFDDINGKPLVGGMLYVYEAGTSVKATTYMDKDGQEENENPVPLNERGECVVFLDCSKEYKFVLKGSLDNVIWEEDYIKPESDLGEGGLNPDDIKPLVLKQFGKNLGTYSPLKGNTITIGDSAVHVAVDHANIHAYLTEIFAEGRTPVLVMSDTDPDTPGVTRDFYFYPTARTGVDSDYSFIGYDGDVVKVATVHDDDTVTYATNDVVGKVHFLKAVSDDLADMRAPYSFWIVDLEKPNANSPYGYDYAMADEIIAQLSAGEIFVLSTYRTAPSPEEDLYIMGSSALQSIEGHEAVRIWFTRMFASGSPEYMYFTTIYTPSLYNDNPLAGGYPEGRMAILNWRGQQDSRSEFRFMPYTELAEVATSGDYDDLSNKPTIPAAQVQSDWAEADSSKVDYIKNKPNLALKENVTNKVQTINDSSTTDYPSSKAVADFVNSSVATNTANFLGTITESSLGLDYTATNAQIALALDVHSWDSPPTNNDYCFVSVNEPQTTDVDEYRRFKFNGSVWAYEYTLNNSSFTQAQWNAINSGIDSTDKAAYDAAVDLLDDHVNDFNNPHNVTAAQIGAESTSNKASMVDPLSETEYPTSKAVANYCSAIATFISQRAVYWNSASCYAGGSADRYFKLASISSEALQNNVNNVWRTIVSTDSVVEIAYLRLKVRLNTAGSQPVGNLNVSPIGTWNYAVKFSLVLRGTVGNVIVELWAHHEGGYRSTVISDMGGGSFSITSPNKNDWTYTSYNNNGSAAIPTDAETQVINAVVDQ